MKKLIYVLILSLVMVSGLLCFAPFSSESDANREMKNTKLISKPLTPAEMKAKREKWEATPDGIAYKKWEASPAGRKVYASEAKIRKAIKDFTGMEAVVTSLSLPSGSRVGYGLMVRINGSDYILTLGTDQSGKNFLNSLKVNEKITIRSHNVSHAPKYSYPILSGDYVERVSKIIYKRKVLKDGC